MTKRGFSKYSKQEILDDLKRVYNEFGYINMPLYLSEGKYGQYQVWKYFKFYMLIFIIKIKR